MILQQLKTETSVMHSELENSTLMCTFRTKSITFEIYILILKKFHTFFSQMETQISYLDIQSHLIDFNDRRKSDLLLSDLKFFGQEPISTTEIVVPAIQSKSEAFGALYVMEGSTLGGKFISAVLQDQLNVGAKTGASFFNGYGEETGSKWKVFCNSLVDFHEIVHQEHQTVLAAQKSFTSLKKWLDV